MWGKNLHTLIADMKETMYKERGVGLAGPQVNETVRVCVINKDVFKGEDDLVLINPTIMQTSKEKEWDEEACLSIPHTWGEVLRPRDIRVKARNIEKETVEFAADGLFARVIQHEIDHLNGILFIEKGKNVRNIRLKS